MKFATDSFSLCGDESVTIQFSRLELGGNVWFQFAPVGLASLRGFSFHGLIVPISLLNVHPYNCIIFEI